MCDPRAFSPTKLKAPVPLPYVSRRALHRVTDWLSPPSQCDVCKSASVALVNNSAVYNGRSYGDWPYIYFCMDCTAYVGVHPDTDLPLGTMCDSDTRDMRKAAKSLFLKINQHHFKRKRDKSYGWLAEKMGIDRSVCHFAMFDYDQAFLALEICNDFMVENEYPAGR